MLRLSLAVCIVLAGLLPLTAQERKVYDLEKSDYPHDVAVGPNGEVWFSGQKRIIPGTRMNTPGLDDPRDRADLIVYLLQSGRHVP